MTERASEKKYAMKEERDAFVAMRDGVREAVDIFRPDGAFQLALCGS